MIIYIDREKKTGKLLSFTAKFIKLKFFGDSSSPIGLYGSMRTSYEEKKTYQEWFSDGARVTDSGPSLIHSWVAVSKILSGKAKKAVTVYFSSEKLLSFSFAEFSAHLANSIQTWSISAAR